MNDGISRRGFLKAFAATALVATTTGTGAALLSEQLAKPAVPLAPALPAPVLAAPVTNSAALSGAAAETLAQLAAAQAENMRLRAELAAAQQRLAGLQTATDNSAVVEVLQAQLNDSSGQVTVLSGLVALYEQLEQIQIEDVVAGGVSVVGGALGALAGRMPTVAEGLAAGAAALDDLESHIPLLENGRLWLEDHVAKIGDFYMVVESVLAAAVETAGNFLANLNRWFQDVLRWVPFGMGEKAAAIMTAMTNLLGETPNTINGLRTNVAQPLDIWLAGQGEEMPLRRALIKPLREKALQPATEAIVEVESVQSLYTSQLVEPVQTAAGNRQAVRDMIAQYRQQHQI
jgi:hypothetical protein